MSGSSSDNENIDMLHQYSPRSQLSGSSPLEQEILPDSSSDAQSHHSNSSRFGDVSDHSTKGCSRASPPSSPVRPGRKRSYGDYKDNPAIPVPRQTLHRWKKSRAEGVDTCDSDNDSSDSKSSKESADSKNSSGSKDSEIRDTEVLEQVSYEAEGNERISTEVFEESLHHGNWSDNSLESSHSGSEDDSENELNVSSDGYSHYSNNSDINDNNSDSGGSDCNTGNNYTFDDDDGSLYPGCQKTKDEAIFEIIDVYLRKKSTKSALTDILKIYVTSLPPSNVLPSSVHLLFKYVQQLSLPLNERAHYYCPAMHSVDSKLDSCVFCGSTDIGVFYEIPLENIIIFLFEHRGLADLIDKYNEARGQRGDNICDVADGTEYTRVWTAHASNRYKVTLMLNTDGVSPHTSSKARFWPLMFSIVEVPPHLRSSFTIVWGIWFDKKFKPNMNLYLKPFVTSLVKIEEAGGVSWKHPLTGAHYTTPVRAPLIVADAPGRAAVLNMQEHQAKYACNACEQKTSKLAAVPTVEGEKRKIRKRRFTFKEEAATLRTHNRMLECGNIGNNLAPKRGIKGVPVIADIPSLDLSTCVVAEYMHSVLCGVVKQICSLWLFEKGPWYIGNYLNEMNTFLEQEIHPPSLVSRLPRSFEYFAYLKASEFRSFLLYFSVVIIAPYHKDEYLQHWLLFVQAIYLLLKEVITENDLISAEALLRLFVRDLGSLYNDEQYVYNVPQLLHLVLYVRRWGCLWSNSAFTFESFNGILSDMVHGSKNEAKELLNQLSLAQGNQMLKNKIVGHAKKTSGVLVLGLKIPRIASEVELDHLKKLNSNAKSDSVEFYGRILVGRETFSSREYDKFFKRRNSYVVINCDNRKLYGQIDIFCKCGDSVLCIVSIFKVEHSKFFYHRRTMVRISHIIPVVDSEEIVACEPKDIVQKLIQVGNFLCVPPNTIEKNI